MLPHEHYGTHLDSSGNTIDIDTEMKNFEKAGQVLCEIWNGMTIDGYPVQCTYRDPLIHVADPPTLDPEWVESHCMISKYCLQIAKCDLLRTSKVGHQGAHWWKIPAWSATNEEVSTEHQQLRTR